MEAAVGNLQQHLQEWTGFNRWYRPYRVLIQRKRGRRLRWRSYSTGLFWSCTLHELLVWKGSEREKYKWAEFGFWEFREWKRLVDILPQKVRGSWQHRHHECILRKPAIRHFFYDWLPFSFGCYTFDKCINKYYWRTFRIKCNKIVAGCEEGCGQHDYGEE